MRKIIARGFVLEFVSIIALIFAIALAWLGDYLGLSAVAVIPASVGISVAAYIWALKWEINRELRDKLSLYTLLESIEDEDLYERGKEAIEECRVKLEDLSKGVLRFEPGHSFRYLMELTRSAKKHIRLTHPVLDERQLGVWQAGVEDQWYQRNVDLARRGVLVERFFILSRAGTTDGTSGKLKPGISAVLQKQAQDGIKVHVLWLDEIDDPDLCREFLVVDENVVFQASQSWLGVYSDSIVYRRKFDIERYIEIFEALRARAHPLSDLSDLLPASQPEQEG